MIKLKTKLKLKFKRNKGKFCIQMADKDDKYPENVKGKYYVDRACIACDACVTTAPDHFGMDENDGHAFLFKQPVTEEEIEMCEEAIEGCPVEAIGNDGE